MANTWGYCVNLKAALEKDALYEKGVTQLGVGQSKDEDRVTSACTRDCTKVLEQAAEGNA